MSESMKNIGANLIEHAEEAPISTRGIINELFPYIYVASKRMGTRAISEWLDKEQNIQLSHVTIYKALKNSEVHLKRIFENIYDAASQLETHACGDTERIFGSKITFMFSKEVFDDMEKRMSDSRSLDPEVEALDFLFRKIRRDWYSLPKEVRAACENFFVRKDNELARNARKS